MRNTYSRWDGLEHISTLVLGTMICSLIGFLLLVAMGYQNPIWDVYHNSGFAMHLLVYIVLITAFITGPIYAWLTWHALRYRPIDSVSDEALPTLSVVVPAYNEGCLVLQTLRSLADSDYPAEKLQIIAVDDGSLDDTWQWIEKARREQPLRIETIRQRRNQGKRKALHTGILNAHGSILVTVDSDSVVDKNTLRNMASPFVVEPRCGAVAGNIRVLNRIHTIPRMLDVSFVFSFEFIRAAQNQLKTVICTPGALAAYRADLVKLVLPEWLEQRFLGQPAKIGEDRALTNLILQHGHHVLFQSNALVYTSVPAKFNSLSKMFIRWGRSNVRENFHMMRYVFKRFRPEKRNAARLLFILQIWRSTMALPIYLFILILVINFPLYALLAALAANVLWGSLRALVYTRNYNVWDSLWSFPYGLYHFVGLSWISAYSFATMWRSGWLTRDLDDQGKSEELAIAAMTESTTISSQ